MASDVLRDDQYNNKNSSWYRNRVQWVVQLVLVSAATVLLVKGTSTTSVTNYYSVVVDGINPAGRLWTWTSSSIGIGIGITPTTWFSVPLYKYIILNLIIITIAASSYLFHHRHHHQTTSSPVLPPGQQSQTINQAPPTFHVSYNAEESTTTNDLLIFESIWPPPPDIQQQTNLPSPPPTDPLPPPNINIHEDYHHHHHHHHSLIFADINHDQRHSLLDQPQQIKTVLDAGETIQPVLLGGVNIDDDQIIQYLTASTITTTDCGVIHNEEEEEEEDTLEATWRAISEERGKPSGGRLLKKSDTWVSPPPQVLAVKKTCRENSKAKPGVDHGNWRELRKSETFNDAVSSARQRTGGLMKRDPSLGQDELNRRVEAFINKFNHDMRLQRQESDQRFLDMISRGL